MSPSINRFRGGYEFLRNPFPCDVILEDDMRIYPTVEHAYQASKTLDLDYRILIRKAQNLSLIKSLGKKAPLRLDWNDEFKLRIMEDLLRQKWRKTIFKRKLLSTWPHLIVEGNNRHDVFWGECDGTCSRGPHEPFGDNNLGKLHMKIREDIRLG